MALQGSFSIFWELPPCAQWSEVLLKDIPMSNLSAQARKVNLCSISTQSMWHPLIMITNTVNDAFAIESNLGEVIVAYGSGLAQVFAPGRYNVLCEFDFLVRKANGNVCEHPAIFLIYYRPSPSIIKPATSSCSLFRNAMNSTTFRA